MVINPAAVGWGTQPPLPPNPPIPVACGHFSVSVQGGRHGQTLPTAQPGGPGTLLGSFALGQHTLVGTRVTITGRHGRRWPEVPWHQADLGSHLCFLALLAV